MKEIHVRLSLYVEVEDREYDDSEIEELEIKILDELLNKDLSKIDSRILPAPEVNYQKYETEVQEM